MKLKKLLLLPLLFSVFILPAKAQITYCEPLFVNGCFGWNNKEITLDSLHWVLGSTDCAVSDYTSMQATLVKGVATPMTVLNGSWCGVGVWIDYNTDGDFDSTENVYYQYTAGDPQTYSFLVTIPASVPDSLYRMRVIAGWGTDCFTVSPNGYGACGNYEYGNFDDFTVNITSNVGVSETKSASFELYPNPAGTSVHLKLDQKLAGKKYSIVDPLGKIVLTGTLNTTDEVVDVSDLSEGIYILSIGESSHKTFKVLR